MRSSQRQFEQKTWPIPTGPIVVFTHKVFLSRKHMIYSDKQLAGHESAYSRDGPLIFHMRDGPPNVTGLPGGTGPPRYSSGSSPPKNTGPPMEWLVRKKTLKRQ